LIEGLLAYSRVGRLGAEMEPVSLGDAQIAARQQLESAITETGAIVEHEALPMVRGNRGQLVQLLQNLIGNALKYRGVTAPRVRISAHRDGAMWTIAIRDNGIGIEAQYFDRVFSIFQRLHTRDEYPGTGIGLAICKRIVEQAGGAIWIESELGVGSTFYFTLPAA
jgi:light-regulated signal transduction histidine kinase (bacteriophytochrome)